MRNETIILHRQKEAVFGCLSHVILYLNEANKIGFRGAQLLSFPACPLIENFPVNSHWGSFFGWNCFIKISKENFPLEGTMHNHLRWHKSYVLKYLRSKSSYCISEQENQINQFGQYNVMIWVSRSVISMIPLRITYRILLIYYNIQRDVFRTLSNIYDGTFCGKVNGINAYI